MTEKGKGLFHQAIIEYNEPNRGHPQYELWLNYALSTNDRGAFLVNTLREIIPSLKGKRHLDIGCGYGGTCLAAARAGAISVGIDISDTLISFARLNSEDHPGLDPQFHLVDVMDWEQVRFLGEYDVVSCDNVIEHVAVTERLIMHIRRLLAPGGFAYLTIPNAFSIGQVREDCHYGLFGISLLDPWDATHYVQHALAQPEYDVSRYYSYPDYSAMFYRYGLHYRLLNRLHASEAEIAALEADTNRLRSEYRAIVESEAVPENIQQKLARVLESYLEGLNSAFSHYHSLSSKKGKNRLGQLLVRDFQEELWYMVVAADQRAFRPLSPLPILRKFLRRARRVVRDRRRSSQPVGIETNDG